MQENAEHPGACYCECLWQVPRHDSHLLHTGEDCAWSLTQRFKEDMEGLESVQQTTEKVAGGLESLKLEGWRAFPVVEKRQAVV